MLSGPDLTQVRRRLRRGVWLLRVAMVLCGLSLVATVAGMPRASAAAVIVAVFLLGIVANAAAVALLSLRELR